MKVLVVVDMQNDFVTGVLGTLEAQSIVPNVVKKIEEFCKEDKHNIIFFTQDTHDENYLETEEGKNLPVAHCIKKTEGWDLIPEFEKFMARFKFNMIRKETFGSDDLGYRLENLDGDIDIESVELIGVCTDICVISNAIIAKSALPNVPIYIDASCCAGVTPEAHDKAIDLMKNSLQIHILNEGEEPWRDNYEG